VTGREAFELSATALRLRPRDHIRGIRRYASIEEAAEDRDRPPRAEGQ
jgi:hypothetical protein